MRLVLLSDTHGLHRKISIPDGDVLIHAGDFCSGGGVFEARAFGAFLSGLPHRHKVVIAGNHDLCLEANPSLGPEIFAGCHYLLDSGVEFEGVSFWGSPWQPWFFDWAFNLERGAELRKKWDLIPAQVDVLITHTPPYGVLDQTVEGESVGCEELLAATQRTRPRLHVFGHVHHGYGVRRLGRMLQVNASSCTERYRPMNPALVVDLPTNGDAVIATEVAGSESREEEGRCEGAVPES